MKRDDHYVRLGYEVGTGRAVPIPVRHTVVCGQTQEAGKTTALEALITRSGLRAVTFVTKRGEGSFVGARRIAPYFRDKAGHWQYVASILEASRGERMKMERSFIIRASKGAHSLTQVHANIKRFLADPKIRGLAADMYLCLDAYLDVVVPAISDTPWAPALDLQPGVNAVDLTGVPAEMQHLVIQSSIDWVLEREADTIVVIPEAWKFVPEGRKTPVKESAAALIRQGAALRNYVWLDSQDIGGISKEILRSCPVWLLGVQREANEVKRTLDNVPDGMPKLKKSDISTLGLGQFYACFGREAIKTYVQPAWLDDAMARQVARGVVDAGSDLSFKRPIFDELPSAKVKDQILNTKEPDVTKDEAERLTRENAELRGENRDLSAQVKSLSMTVTELQQQVRELASGLPAAAVTPPPTTTAAVLGAGTSAPFPEGHLPVDFDTEGLYQAFKLRLQQDAPALLKLVTTRPEIEMTVTRKTITIDETSQKGRIAKMLKEGFFAEPRGCGAVRHALKRTGNDINTANIGRILDEFKVLGFVTEPTEGQFQSVDGMIVNIVEAE